MMVVEVFSLIKYVPAIYAIFLFIARVMLYAHTKERKKHTPNEIKSNTYALSTAIASASAALAAVK